MKASAPCGRPPQPACPHVLWQKDSDRPRGIVRNGVRDGYQRYLCKLCTRVFPEPSHGGIRRLAFKNYRPVEALSVLAHADDEKRSHIAERLGVNRSRITQWEKRHADVPLQLLDPGQVEDGRYARRTGIVEWAPFSVAEADAEILLKASFGELSYWAKRLKVFTKGELQSYADKVQARSLSLDDRRSVLNALRQALREIKPSLFMPPDY